MSFRELRVRAGLSVAQVMSALNVSDAAVYMWETGATKPSTKRLLQIAELYNCTIDELLTDNAQA